MRILSRKALINITGLALITGGLVGWIFFSQQTKPSPITDYDSCIKSGRAPSTTIPRECAGPDGTIYREVVQGGTKESPEPAQTNTTNDTQSDQHTPLIMTFTSAKGIQVKLNDWLPDRSLSSPATITGEIPGSWSFEASFPVSLVTKEGVLLTRQAATLYGDWMTDSYVPFSISLTFTAPDQATTGLLILERDNPSGLPDYADAISIPVQIH